MALEDALTAYRWLLAQGHAPKEIVLAGDSAGGGLALDASDLQRGVVVMDAAFHTGRRIGPGVE